MNAPITLTRLSGFDRNKKLSFEVAKVSLGTDAACDVRFDPTWDKTVSSRHAELVFEGNQWWVVDASRAGTLVDGQVVKRRKLTPGVVLELGAGGPKVKVEWTPAPAADASAETAPARSASAAHAPGSAAAPPPLPAAAAPHAARPTMKGPVASDTPSLAAGSRAGSPRNNVAIAALAVAVVALLAVSVWWFFGRGGDIEQGLAAVAREKAGAVGLVVGVHPGMADGEPQGVATAWAVAPRVFATNSHVIESIDEVLRDGGTAFIVINRNGELRLRITGTRLHPRYGKSLLGFNGKEPAVPAFDVGLLLTEQAAPTTLRIADNKELAKVDSGYRIGYLGFPMEGMAGGGADVRNPVATMQSGIVTSATDFWLAKAEYPQRLLIQHNLGATGGASGSPIFNAAGEVVGILSAGNISGVLQNGNSIARVPSGVMVNFGQRIDMLRDIWSEYPHK